MTGWLPAPAEELFGPEATAEESYGVLTVDVPSASWTEALRTARSTLGCTYFDWLSAVDEPGTGFRVAAHVVALAPVRRLLLRTTVPHEAPVLPTAVDIYAGAAWHERETHEMFGVRFEGHPALDHLLLPETFEGHPLRKDFVLAARVAKAWPGAKEPGESAGHGAPKRRQMLPPGVPDPNEWGPLKGQLPPAPARPARGAAARPAGDRPARRTRTADEGSAGQTTPGTPTDTPASPRRTRTTAEGSASLPTTAPAPDASGPPASPRRARSAAEGSASRPTAGPAPDASGSPTAPRRARSASGGSASPRVSPPEAPGTGEPPAQPSPTRPAARSTDAPWHQARPAFDEPAPEAVREPQPKAEPATQPEPEAPTSSEADAEADAQSASDPATADERTPTPHTPPRQPEPPGTPPDKAPASQAPGVGTPDDNGGHVDVTPDVTPEATPDDAPDPNPPKGGSQ
ncbi:NADH-quinone oxidoreductase subunit C [Streptomyces europaeiscabiei]|uniref:NADH-quinone oxidoreductase subunit C n=1 Tax=Streptomyces europaeiscabiei TaxID=146819 RepID=UPI0038F5F4AC